MGMKENLEQMLERGQDSALLRFTLGELYLKEGDAEAAAGHLAQAVRQKADYSAAWKLYGQALERGGRAHEAARAFEQGIAVAEQTGDKQAAKEMRVFLRRVQRG